MTLLGRIAVSTALACAGLAAAIAPSAATGFDTIAGQWCSASGSTDFTLDTMIVRVKGGATYRYEITRYDYENDEIVVVWLNNGRTVHTTYGTFSADGKTMIQQKTKETGEIPHTRC